MLKFIKERFNKLVVTLDLDAISNVKQNFEKAGYIKDSDYFVIGLDKPGYRCVEGLLPDFIKTKVNNDNPELVFGLQSENQTERKSAKDKLKALYLKKIKKDLKYDKSYFSEFYKLAEKMNKKLNNAT